MSNPIDLQRFIDAQASAYDQALAELKQGRKRSHWIWFVFPQIHGLGHSAMSQRYAIASRAEALAYLQHPLLGPRLRECVEAVLAVEGRPIETILGPPDDLKFRSSMTLFAAVAAETGVAAVPFERALQKYFDGERDPLTLSRL
jgi:uncharacterized protein (DUF1810 family)